MRWCLALSTDPFSVTSGHRPPAVLISVFKGRNREMLPAHLQHLARSLAGGEDQPERVSGPLRHGWTVLPQNVGQRAEGSSYFILGKPSLFGSALVESPREALYGI